MLALNGHVAGTEESSRRRALLVRIQLFALAKEKAGRSAVELELPAHAQVSALRLALGQACPALAPLLPNLMIALNSEYADDAQEVPEGAEVAAIPPVSGG
jgi:molybdopterin converting factor subunit 1